MVYEVICGSTGTVEGRYKTHWGADYKLAKLQMLHPYTYFYIREVKKNDSKN